MTTSNCPRCTKPFECKSSDIANCQCTSIALDQNTAEYLRKTSYDCLCATCLKELDDIVTSIDFNVDIRKANLIENEHYYIEHGKYVFMEKYHIHRGYCCKNGCRHCAYGYKK